MPGAKFSAQSNRLQQEAARWFLRMHNADPDHPDRGRFEAWLTGNPAHAKEYFAFSSVWEDFDSTSKLQSLAHAMKQKRVESPEFTQRITRSAAKVLSLMLVVGAGLFGHHAWKEWQAQPLMQLANTTGIAEMQRQKLHDGSELVLNADTDIKIVYYRDKRTVKLNKGEVIFNIARDVDRPFVIDSGEARITVLGTRFAVNRLHGRVRVSVDHGSVKVETQNANGEVIQPSVILTNGDVAEVNNQSPPERLRLNASDAFSFQNGTLNFNQASLAEIAETLSRYRKIPVRNDHSAPSDARVTAVVKTVDIEGFLRILPDIAAIEIRQTADATTLVAK